MGYTLPLHLAIMLIITWKGDQNASKTYNIVSVEIHFQQMIFRILRIRINHVNIHRYFHFSFVALSIRHFLYAWSGILCNENRIWHGIMWETFLETHCVTFFGSLKPHTAIHNILNLEAVPFNIQNRDLSFVTF